MSNYLLKLQVNELGAELSSLSAYTKAAVFAAGLHNPLQSPMECLDPSTSTRYPINNASSITTQTLGASGDITVGGHASLNTATVTETLNVGFLTTTEPITAAAGLKTDSITENIAGAGIAITGSATFEQDSYFNGDVILRTGTVTTNNIAAYSNNDTINILSLVNFEQGLELSGGITTTGNITANTLTATGSVVANTLSANPVSGTITALSNIQANENLTVTGNITSSAGVSATTLFATSSIVCDQTITAGSELDTQHIKTDTIEAFSASSVAFESPITSTQNITTTGGLSAATLALTGALTVDDIEIQTINFDSKRPVEVFGNLTLGTGTAINGTTPTNPYQAQYNINNVAALSASSVGSNQVSTNVIQSNTNASPNPTNTILFGSNLQLTNPTVTSNYNITCANTIGMIPAGSGITTDTKIRSAPTPTVGTGCLQVSSTVNGTPGTWGTVYDTVYNIPPSVGSVTLEEVLTAGSIAADKTMTISGVLLSDGDGHINEIFTGGNPTIGPTLAVTRDNGTSVGLVYDSLYNKPQTSAFSNITNLIYPAGSTYVDLEYNPSPDYLVGDIAQFRLNNNSIAYNNVTLTATQFSITGASSLQGKVFTLYLTTNRSSYYYPDSDLDTDNMVMVHSQTLDFSTVTLPTPLVIPNLFLETILPVSQAGITIYMMISISKFNFSQGRVAIGVNWTGLSIAGENVDTPNGAFSLN